MTNETPKKCAAAVALGKRNRGVKKNISPERAAQLRGFLERANAVRIANAQAAPAADILNALETGKHAAGLPQPENETP